MGGGVDVEQRERPRLKLKPRSKPVEEIGGTKADSAIFGEAKPVDAVAKEVEKLKVEN